VQLPAETMEEFQRSVDWSAPDHADKASRLAQRMVLDALQRYQQGRNSALGTYRDKNHPTQVAETFASLLHEIKALPAYLTEMRNRPTLEHYMLPDRLTATGNTRVSPEARWPSDRRTGAPWRSPAYTKRQEPAWR
jgi:hypothetical protein